jgi:hypothetical protein
LRPIFYLIWRNLLILIVVPLQSAFDIQRVALHELGHVFGLDRPDEAGQQVDAIMDSFISNG